MTDVRVLDSGTESIPKMLLRFSVPAIIGMMINASYNLVDRIFVGNGVGSDGLGAIAVCYPPALLQLALGFLIGVGGSVNFAVSLGQKRYMRAERIMTNAFVMIIVLTGILVIANYVFLTPLLRLFGATDSLMPFAETYMKITLAGVIFFTFNIVAVNFIRACGFPKTAMFVLLIGAVSNMILDPIFIFVLKGGIAGAAWATAAVQVLSFGVIMWFFVSKRSPCYPRRKFLIPDFRIAGMIVAVGTAPFLIQLANGFMQTVLNKSLVFYGGDVAVSAMGVTLAVTILMFMPAIGLCEGAQPLIGYNLGAQNYKRMIGYYLTTIGASVVFFAADALVARFFGREIIAFFNPKDAALIDVGTMSLRIICMVLPLVGLQMPTVFFLQATKCPKMASFLALSRQLIFLVPALLILPRFFGLKGVYYALPFADGATFCVALPVCIWQIKKYSRLFKEKNNFF